MAREFRLLCSFLIFVVVMQFVVSGEPQVPCYFIFGDSMIDNGNNNNFAKAAKANYWPYGIDFPQGVTGRFTNGRTFADLIGQLLGFSEFIPPYTTATAQEISTGVNYASGAAGIREESGSNLGDRISFDRQLNNHITTISRLSTVLKSNKTYTNEHLKKCIYLLNIGNNDYINNYLMPSIYPTSDTYTVDEYAPVLVEKYSQQLKMLYYLGARKVAVFGLGYIGCTPTQIARSGTDGELCVEWINDAVKIFNQHLRSLINELNNDYTDARFTLINLTSIFAPQEDLPISSPPCCPVREDGECVENSTPCHLRALSDYYDGFHPTETVNTVIAARSYIKLTPMDASPYDISHLAQL